MQLFIYVGYYRFKDADKIKYLVSIETWSSLFRFLVQKTVLNFFFGNNIVV